LTVLLAALLFRPRLESVREQRGMEADSARNLRANDWRTVEPAGMEDMSPPAPGLTTLSAVPPPPPPATPEPPGGPVPGGEARGGYLGRNGVVHDISAPPASKRAKVNSEPARHGASELGRDALAELRKTIVESNRGFSGRAVAELAPAKRELQVQLDSYDDSFRPMEAGVQPLPPSRSTSSSTALGQHSDGSSWEERTVTGGVFSAKPSVEGNISLERLASRPGVVLDGASVVGGVSEVHGAGDRSTREEFEVKNADYTPLSGGRSDSGLIVEASFDDDADTASGFRRRQEETAEILDRPLADAEPAAGEGRAPSKSVRKKRGFVVAADPLNNITEEVRYKVDEDPPAGGYQREIGVSLAVTPSVLPDGTVRMTMRPRSAQLVDEIVSESGHRYPASESLRKKVASVPPGHSLVVGGFYGQVKTKDDNKVPLLGDIPEINLFLKGEETAEEDPSLLFVVTPTTEKGPAGGKDLVTFDTKILKVNDSVAEQRVPPGETGVPAEEIGQVSALLGVGEGEPAGDGAIVLSAEQTNGVLQALAEGGLVKQISNPTLITEDDTQTTISLVDRVPIITTTVNQTEVPEPEPEPEPLPEEPEKNAKDEPWSTFSLNVSDVSFKLAKAALARGEWPAPDQVRVEEFVNAFDYGDPSPSQEEKVACNLEQAAHPFMQQRNLLRVSMKTAALGRSANTPLRLTVLLDNSGSMDRSDRVESVKNAFRLLASQLTPADQVTLIGFARTPRLLADRVTGDQVAELARIVDSTPSAGGTNIEEALKLGLEKAQEQLLDGAQNRVILLTDGAVNLGNARPRDLATLVEHMRGNGIAFDACGVGADGLNDEVLEALTRKGDGRYYFLDRPEDADDGFARQIAGALRPAARNVKVQVHFNPDRVGRYKLYGFNKHLLKKEDFRDDSVDAAELAAAEAGNAIYQFEPLPEGSGDIGTVSVRFQDTGSGQMIERQWTIPYAPRTPRLEDSAASLRLASGAALLGEKLQGSAIGEAVEMADLGSLLSGLPGEFPADQRVTDLMHMANKARELSGE